MMKTYLMKESREMFVFVFETNNKSVTIFQSQANDERTFIFVTVKKKNESIKKKKINKINSFFEKSIVSTD